jgi:protein-S-isoprenylcysteine O-methyltransferase Ste14
VVQLAGVPPVVDATAVDVAGLVLAVVGILATLVAQNAMGNSWRIGVDQQETTTLVTGGPFALVRNPVFTTMTTAGLGLVLLAPNIIGLLGLATLVAAIQLQVRVVEEPYLLATHGTAYRDYAARVGRFLPGLGLLPAANLE